MGLTSSLDRIDSLENYRQHVRSSTIIYIEAYGKSMESAFQVPCCSLVYVLELEGGKWYVGTSNQINLRIAAHFTGNGSRWTKLHKPVRIHKVCLGGRDVETRVTLEIMAEKGWQHVRGGGWCKPVMRRPPSDLTAFVNSREGEVELTVTDSTP